MKKIYIMILAAFTLLTLSLNAQVGVPTINYKAVNKSGSRTHNSGVHQAPAQIKASEGEFYVGPYTNDDFSTTGKSLYDVTGAGQVEVSTEIPRSVVEQYIGQEIVGFRFATIGTVSCYSFQIESLTFNDYIDDLYYWDLPSSNGSPVTMTGSAWHEFYLDEPVVFQLPDETKALWIGYKYNQTASNSPIAVNPAVTAYDCYAYSYSSTRPGFHYVTTALNGALAAQLIFRGVGIKTATPFISYETTDDAVIITAMGDGTVTLTVDGQTATGEGSATITMERGVDDQTVTAVATAQEAGKALSDEATLTIIIGSGFQLLDPQPATATTPINLKNLMFVDRFSVEIPNDNSHPFLYDYTLEQGNKSSNSVEAYVLHTSSNLTSQGQGFYSLNQIDNDTDGSLKMNVMNSAMNIELSPSSAPFFYTIEREDNGEWTWVAVLQRTTDGNYQQTLKGLYNYGEIYEPGYFTQFDLDTITGEYNSYKAYVPVVWTMGHDRVGYDEVNPIHNSYGAAVLKTGVAKIEQPNGNATVAERQTNQWNSVNWTAEGGPASLYILDNIEGMATMPTVNTVEFEPYMFRVFVKSKNGLLRNYKKVDGVPGSAYPGEHLEAAYTSEQDKVGPICVWSGYVNDPLNDYYGVEIATINGDKENNIPTTITFKKNKVGRTNPNDDWTFDDANAMFGALDVLAGGQSIDPDDLEVFVRFYYVVDGVAVDHIPGSRDNGDAAGYGSESPGSSPEPATSVSEVRHYGEVVGTTYINVQGMTSEEPFDGVNIVVTRYSDGSTKITKVVR